jgi:hypothetical protein
MNYKQYIIKKGDNELGLLWYDIEQHLLTPEQFRKFNDFMRGQTMGMLGDSMNMIGVVYTGDFLKFLRKYNETS